MSKFVYFLSCGPGARDAATEGWLEGRQRDQAVDNGNKGAKCSPFQACTLRLNFITSFARTRNALLT